MQKVLGYMRKAVQQYGLIRDGDRIMVGVSGGKDSLVLLYGLTLLRRFIGIEYEVVGVTLDMGFTGEKMDFSPVERFCAEHDIEYHIIKTQIAEIVFDVRKEPSPCSLCARMRRGALHDAANELGCNKVALGHNYDDAVETFIMNLFTEGRIGCFSPSTYLTHKNVTVIRPLVLAPEKEVRRSGQTLTAGAVLTGRRRKLKTKIKRLSFRRALIIHLGKCQTKLVFLLSESECCSYCYCKTCSCNAGTSNTCLR